MKVRICPTVTCRTVWQGGKHCPRCNAEAPVQEMRPGRRDPVTGLKHEKGGRTWPSVRL